MDQDHNGLVPGSLMSSPTRIKLKHKGGNDQVDVLPYSAVCTKCSPAKLTRGIVVKITVLWF